MDMGLRAEVETGLSKDVTLRDAGQMALFPRKFSFEGSTQSAEQFLFEAQRLADDVRRALSSDLSLATKKAARLSFLLTTMRPGYQRSGPVRGGLIPWQKAKVEAYIKDRLDEPLPINDLAKLVALSASRFNRVFKESFGETPHAYVVRMRVARAQVLMVTTSDAMCQIALTCGFADQAHLCRSFRRVTGATPAYWRRRQPPGSSLPWPPTALDHLGAPWGCDHLEAD